MMAVLHFEWPLSRWYRRHVVRCVRRLWVDSTIKRPLSGDFAIRMLFPFSCSICESESRCSGAVCKTRSELLLKVPRALHSARVGC